MVRKYGGGERNDGKKSSGQLHVCLVLEIEMFFPSRSSAFIPAGQTLPAHSYSDLNQVKAHAVQAGARIARRCRFEASVSMEAGYV